MVDEINDESISGALKEIECGECTIVSSVEEMWKALDIKLREQLYFQTDIRKI